MYRCSRMFGVNFAFLPYSSVISDNVVSYVLLPILFPYLLHCFNIVRGYVPLSSLDFTLRMNPRRSSASFGISAYKSRTLYIQRLSLIPFVHLSL